eukprot:CAMPEP_0115093172 /NCGR_PEP_ID=MMETSP0227-20121206/27335_1 /TAXON_ID=89957 /ORGANISM="Polarella glacialis, Strain CCMP 1383" /LENGTH=80 /DNA_ID=CAMNT_0002485395 /DNA_START=67 /DNA_END=305 /DNA_ORIENTATION=+
MGSGASSEMKPGQVSEATMEELTAALEGLSPEERQRIKDALGAVSTADPCPGPVDCSSLSVVVTDYNGLLPQPAEPKFKG